MSQFYIRPWFAVTVGALIAILLWYFDAKFLFSEKTDFASILGTVAQVSASMMGFMLAALAILASIADKPLVILMRSSGHYNDLLFSLFSTSALFACAFVISVLKLMIGIDFPFAGPCLVGAMVGGLVGLAQVGRKFWLLLINLSPEMPSKPPLFPKAAEIEDA